MKYLIIGAGAIGTYIGGSLLRSGQSVRFVEKENVAERIRENGLRIVLNTEQFIVRDIQVYSDFAEAVVGGVDVVMFAMKSFDTSSAVQMIASHTEKFNTVLSLQNGVENEFTIAESLGDDRVIGGSVTSAIERMDIGQVKVEKKRGIGIAAGHQLSAPIVQEFSTAGLNARLFPVLQDMKWSKMLSNLLGNATSAILNMTPAEVFADPAVYSIEVLEMREAVQVMNRLGIRVVNLPGVPMKLLRWMMIDLPRQISQALISKIIGAGRGNKMPSFHIDLHAGQKKMESGYLNGAVRRFGKSVNIATPINDILDQTIQKLAHDQTLIKDYDHNISKLLQDIQANSSIRKEI